jgi:major vault protein
MIYFPRPEHAIIKYRDQEIHYALAIPAGEGRYVLDRLSSGRSRLQRGPCIFLPDPRREVIVRRVLDARTRRAVVPGQQRGARVQPRLSAAASASEGGATSSSIGAATRSPQPGVGATQGRRSEPAERRQARGVRGRRGSHAIRRSPRRAPSCSTRASRARWRSTCGRATRCWWSTAAGARRVIVGPTTHLLEYDETLQSMELSAPGTPKSDATS